MDRGFCSGSSERSPGRGRRVIGEIKSGLGGVNWSVTGRTQCREVLPPAEGYNYDSHRPVCDAYQEPQWVYRRQAIINGRWRKRVSSNRLLDLLEVGPRARRCTGRVLTASTIDCTVGHDRSRQRARFFHPRVRYTAALTAELGSLTIYKPCCGTLLRMPNSRSWSRGLLRVVRGDEVRIYLLSTEFCP
jgi:hypothetical protein